LSWHRTVRCRYKSSFDPWCSGFAPCSPVSLQIIWFPVFDLVPCSPVSLPATLCHNSKHHSPIFSIKTSNPI
jgi:hypothetical protein